MLGSHYPSCRELRRLLDWARASILLYHRLVEPVMGHPRHAEALSASRVALEIDCSRECTHVAGLRERIEGAVVCVIGPKALVSDDVESLVEGCDELAAPEGGHIALVAGGIKALYVTGDLDSSLLSIASMAGSTRYLLVHVHGDNHYRIPLASMAGGGLVPVLYTSQVDSIGCVLSLGGYTDGDRAAIVSMGLGAREVRMIGFGSLATRDLERARSAAIPFKDYVTRSVFETSKLKYELGMKLLAELARIKGYDAVWRESLASRSIGFKVLSLKKKG